MDVTHRKRERSVITSIIYFTHWLTGFHKIQEPKPGSTCRHWAAFICHAMLKHWWPLELGRMAWFTQLAKAKTWVPRMHWITDIYSSIWYSMLCTPCICARCLSLASSPSMRFCSKDLGNKEGKLSTTDASWAEYWLRIQTSWLVFLV